MYPAPPLTVQSGDCPNEVVIGGLPSSADKYDMQRIASQFGEVCNLAILPSGVAPKAVITYASSLQAAHAIGGLNATADYIRPRQHASFEEPRKHIEDAKLSDIVFIEHFPEGWNEQHFISIFSNFGLVLACCIHRNPGHGGKEALVRMESVSTACQAISALESYIAQDQQEDPHMLPMRMRFFDCMPNTGSPTPQPSMVAPEIGKGAAVNKQPEVALGGNSFTDALPQTAAIPITGERHERSALSGGTPPASPLGALSTPPNSWDPQAAQQPSCSHRNSLSLTASEEDKAPASPHTPTDPHSRSSTSRVSASASMSKSIYVSNLPPEADSLWVYERFAPYGGVLSVKVLQEQKSGRCRGVCFVNYMDPQGAASALKSLDGVRIAGRLLQVRLQETRR